MKTRSIEMIVCFPEGSWTTWFVDIPANTHEDLVEQTAIAEAERNMKADTAYIGVYCTHDDGLEEEDDFEWDEEGSQ